MDAVRPLGRRPEIAGRGRHGTGPGRRPLPWGRLAAGAVALLLMVPNSSVLEHRAVLAVFLLALATGRGRQFLLDWLPLVSAAALFVLLRQLAAASPLPHQGGAVAALEAALFGGTTPTALLQRQWFSGQPGALDYAATAVHASYFFGFVVVGLWTWLRLRSHFRRYTALLATTFALGLVGYVAAPTEPPWLVARQSGWPEARRIIVETTERAPVASAVVAASRPWQRDPDALGDPNPSAAMPSVHLAITLALALFLARIHRLAGALGAVYTLAMGLSLVYLGEHFVLDLVAGAACAGLAAWLTLRSRGGATGRAVAR